jgi:hypothetical protein
MARDFFLVQSLQSGSEVHQNSYSVSTGSCFTWMKRLVYKTGHLLRHSSEVKSWRSYASKPQRASFPEREQLFMLFLFMLEINMFLKKIVVRHTDNLQKIKGVTQNEVMEEIIFTVNYFHRQEITKFYRLFLHFYYNKMTDFHVVCSLSLSNYRNENTWQPSASST